MRKREVAIQISEHEYDTSIEYSVDPTSKAAGSVFFTAGAKLSLSY